MDTRGVCSFRSIYSWCNRRWFCWGIQTHDTHHGDIQGFYLRGVTELNADNFNINYDYEDLYKMWLAGPANPAENYKIVVGEYSSRIDDALNALGVDFVEYLKKTAPAKVDKIPLVIIAVAEHQAQRTLVIDPMITLLSCVMKLQTIIQWES